MKKLGLSWHALYRFPTVYFAALALSALTGHLIPPNGLPHAFAAVVSLLFTAILFYSASRLLIIFEKQENLYEGEKTAREMLAFIFKRFETRLFFLLFLLLPLPFPILNPIWGGLAPIFKYLLSRLYLPVLFLSYFLGCLTGLVFHEENEKKKKLRKRINRAPLLFILHVFKYVPIYFVGAYCLLAFCVVLVSLPGIALLLLSTSLGGTILLAIAIVWTVRAVRALRIRKRFLEQLKSACDAAGIPTPEITEPIRSLFRKKECGSVFTFSLDGRVYACKLISTLRPASVFRFYPNGDLGYVRVSHVRIMHGRFTHFGGLLYRQRLELYERKCYIGFEAEEDVHKIFIFNPCSKTVEGSYGTQLISLDNGMKIGEYTFYTATGFTNALMRNCLHRRANE